jgi:hypothetical protein
MRVIITNDLQRDFEVHADGCRDVARRDRQGFLNDFWFLDIPAGADVETAAAADVNEGITVEEGHWPVRVLPCVANHNV